MNRLEIILESIFDMKRLSAIITFFIAFISGIWVNSQFHNDIQPVDTVQNVTVVHTSDTVEVEIPVYINLPVDTSSIVGSFLTNMPIVHDTVYIDTSKGIRIYQYKESFDYDSVGFSVQADVSVDSTVSSEHIEMRMLPFNVWYKKHSQIISNTDTEIIIDDRLKYAFIVNVGKNYTGKQFVLGFSGLANIGKNYFSAMITTESMVFGYGRAFEF